jgi:hypothetical protein
VGEASLPAKRKRGGNGSNRPTLSLEDQLQAEGVAALNPATFRFNSKVVFENIPKKGEATCIDPYLASLFDQMWLAQNEIPQLRTYLRPFQIREAVFAQLEDELPPLSKQSNKHGKRVTLDMKYAIYESNRRNQAKPLKRLSVTSEAAKQLDEHGCTLAKKQKLSSVLNVIDLTVADPRERAASEHREAWLAKVKAEPIQPQSEPRKETEAVATAAAAAGAAAAQQLLQGVLQAHGLQDGSPLFPRQFNFGSAAGPPKRPRPPINSNVNVVAPSQLSTTKAVPLKEKAAREKERSSTSAAAYSATPAGAAMFGSRPAITPAATAGADSSDEEGAHAAADAAPPAARRKQPKPPAPRQPATKPEHTRSVWESRY